MSVIDTEYLGWLKKNNVKWKNVEPAFVEEGWRGIIATGDLQPGDVMIEVPEKVLLSCREQSISPELRAVLFSSQQPLSDHEILAILLILEVPKGRKSVWHPFIASIPKNYTTLAYFSSHCSRALQDDHAAERVQEVKRNLQASWRKCKPVLKALEIEQRVNNFETFVWACTSRDSRVMHVPWSPAGAFVPFADFFNYRPPAAAQYCHIDSEVLDDIKEIADTHDMESTACGNGFYDESSGMYRIVTHKRYCKGQQVFLCYGAHTNLELLEHYGFLLEENPYDTVLISKYSLPSSLSSAQEIRDLKQQDCFLHANGVPSWELMKCLRLVSLSTSEKRTSSYSAHNGTACSVTSERKVIGSGAPLRAWLGCHAFWIRIKSEHAITKAMILKLETRDTQSFSGLEVMRILKEWCQDYSTQFPTSIEEDQIQLKAALENQDEMLELAIRYRLCQKRIVQKASKLADRCLRAAEP